MPAVFLSVELKQGSCTIRVTQAGKEVRESLICKTTDPMSQVTAQAVLAAAPWSIDIGAPHADDASLLCTEVHGEPYGAAFRSPSTTLASTWLFKVTWSNVSGTAPPNPDPLLRVPEIRWVGETQIGPFFRDYSAAQKPVANSSGERFETMPERELGFLTLTYTRNEASPDIALLWDYMHVVNKFPFTIDGKLIPAGHAKLHISDMTKLTENGLTFYRITYEFKFSAFPWNPLYILDVGYNEWVASDPVTMRKILAPIRDTDGLELRRPSPLDGSGGPAAEPALLEFTRYEEWDFSVLNFS